MRQTLCCGVERRALHLTERSIPGAVTRDHRSHSGSLLHFSQRHFEATLQQYLVVKVKRQSKILTCVFTGSDVSATPQRLWPGAQWTIAVQGPKKGKRLVYGYNRRRPHHEEDRRAISPRPPERPGAIANFKKSVAGYTMKSVLPIPLAATSRECNQGCRNPRENREDEASQHGQSPGLSRGPECMQNSRLHCGKTLLDHIDKKSGS